MANWSKHQHDVYYLFENKKTKDVVKVITKDDEPTPDIQRRYRISEEFIFKGIYDVSSNDLVSKTARFIEKEEQIS